MLKQIDEVYTKNFWIEFRNLRAREKREKSCRDIKKEEENRQQGSRIGNRLKR